MKGCLKIILSSIIFLVSMAVYLFFLIIWVDNNTIFTINNCTKEQQAAIQDETKIVFPASAKITQIKHTATWGNDTHRYFTLNITMDGEDFEQFEINLPNEKGRRISYKIVEQTNNLYQVVLYYFSERSIPLSSWMREIGQENTFYKSMVTISGFVIIILLTAVPLLPYQKIFHSRKVAIN